MQICYDFNFAKWMFRKSKVMFVPSQCLRMFNPYKEIILHKSTLTKGITHNLEYINFDLATALFQCSQAK